MANEVRSRTNLVSGTLSVALSNVDTTMSSAGLANLATITAANHAVIVIESEIIYVTAHTAAATTATILRAQEGTSAAAHSINVAWLHGPVVSDYDSILGYAQITANQSPFTAIADIAGLSVTATVPYAGHRVRISSYVLIGSTVAADVLRVSLTDGSNNVIQIAEISSGVLSPVQPTLVLVPAAGSQTWKLRASRQSGSGTVTVDAAAGFPAWILVEDLGPAL